MNRLSAMKSPYVSTKFLIITELFFLVMLAFVYYYSSHEFSATSSLYFKLKSIEKVRSRVELNQVIHGQEFNHIMKWECSVYNLSTGEQCHTKLANLNAQIKAERDAIASYDPCQECANGDGVEKRIIYYHTFWQIKENSSDSTRRQKRVMKLNIMSFLATQNLCCSKLLFWKLKEFPNDTEQELSQFFGFYLSMGALEIRTFDSDVVCNNKKSLFMNSSICADRKALSLSFANKDMVGFSDFFRFVILDIYEGIYTDGDIIYLNDMQLLWDESFAYRWSKAEFYNTGSYCF